MAVIFVSYATEDEAVARQINAAIRKAGLEPWLDLDKVPPGGDLLGTIARGLEKADCFVLVLSRMAITKPWVHAEMRMALTSEIEQRRPTVIIAKVDDCELPFEVRHKRYLDFREGFDSALEELLRHVRGFSSAPPAPKQTVLAEMIRDADAELWHRLSMGGGSRGEWKQGEASDAIRGLQSNDLEAAVAIGWEWSGSEYKKWASELLPEIVRVTGASEAGAQRLVRRLLAAGFLEEADDLDYRRESEKAYSDSGILWILRRAARRSGLFPALPPPIPERLSALLASEMPVDLRGPTWYALRFKDAVVSALDPKTPIVAAVVASEPEATWVFRSPDDRVPLKVNRIYALTDLTPSQPFASLGASEKRTLELVGFTLSVFDDLGVLK